MDELDNFLGDELADINDMFEEFTTKDKQVKEKRQKEVLDLKHIDEELKLKNEVHIIVNDVLLGHWIVCSEAVLLIPYHIWSSTYNHTVRITAAA